MMKPRPGPALLTEPALCQPGCSCSRPERAVRTSAVAIWRRAREGVIRAPSARDSSVLEPARCSVGDSQTAWEQVVKKFTGRGGGGLSA